MQVLSNVDMQALMNAIDRVQGVVRLDLSGRVLSANANFCQWVGYEPEEIAGQPHSLLCKPDYVASEDYREFWQRLSSGEFHAGEFARLAKDGRTIWIQASYNPVFDESGKVLSVVKFATDITAEKMRTAEFEAKLRALDLSQGVIEFLPDGTILSANDNFLRAVGYPRDEVVGRHHSMFCDAELVASSAYREFWARLGRGEFSAGEYKRYRKDGRSVWLQATYNPVFDADGNTIKVVKFASDVTPIKLRNADFEAKIRALELSQGVVEFDLQGRVLHANENFLRIMSYSLDQVQGRHHLMFCEESYVRSPAYAQFWRELAQGRFKTGEFKRIDSLGREIWLQASYNPVFDLEGRPVKIVKFAADVTEEKKRNAEFAGVVTAIKRSVPVIEFDLKGRVLDVSPQMAAILEYVPDDLIGQHHTTLIDPQSFDQAQYLALWASLRRGEAQLAEVERVAKSGRCLFLKASYTPVADPEGRIYKVIKFAVDLTERHTLNQALKDAVTRAEEATQAKTMFLANMSHEIRTPMNAIIGFTDLLGQESLSDKQLHYLDTVGTSARSLLHLLNDILDASKMEHGSMQIEQVDFSLHAVCEHCHETMLVLSRKKNIGLEFVYEDGLNRFFTGDPERIRQIVVNLMSNAIKFTERGSVSLRVGRASDGMVMISVRDTGIGIPADRIEQIFEPFSQADGSITRKYGGTGLGTTIVRQLVSLMEGRIEVSSEVGRGSEFRVILPLKAGNEPLERARIEAGDLRPLRILVADDAPVNIDLLVNVLGRAGHQLVTAENGQLAVDRYAEGVFDLVLMDIQMPVLTGLEATREIRKIENERGSPRVPIIALTADVDAELRFVAVDAGMDGFIMKPLDMALLRAEMTRLVGGAGSPAAALQPHKRVAEAAPPTTVPIARDSIDWGSGIERWGSEAALVRAIRTFVVETKPQLVTLRNEPKPDGERVKQVMHRFRGASGNLSLPKIAAVARAAELEAAVIDADAYLAALATIASEVEIIDSLVAASATTRLPVEAPRGEIDEAAMAELVGRVAATLRNFEIDESLLVELSAVCDPRTFGAIQTALDSFDFEAALQALEVLQQPAQA